MRSTDAFAYSLAKSIASAGASAAAGYLASKSGLGGFASTLAASLAESYVANSMDAQLAPPEAKRTKTESKLSSISTASTVSFNHNGNGFRAVNVSMDGRDLGEVIHAVKSQIFDEALAQNLPTEEAVKSVTECTKLLEDNANSVKSAQEAMEQIDRNCQAKMAEKLIEVADESPIDAQCEAQQVNLTEIVDSILEAADQKIEILNQKNSGN